MTQPGHYLFIAVFIQKLADKVVRKYTGNRCIAWTFLTVVSWDFMHEDTLVNKLNLKQWHLGSVPEWHRRTATNSIFSNCAEVLNLTGSIHTDTA